MLSEGMANVSSVECNRLFNISNLKKKKMLYLACSYYYYYYCSQLYIIYRIKRPQKRPHVAAARAAALRNFSRNA